MKKVSIIVRTCGRPGILRQCLKSIKEQDYPDIETVVVEDGRARSKRMIEAEYPDMNIRYMATGSKVGRAAAGNIALKEAVGDYLNFLDDDDEFFPDHVSTLVRALEGNSCRAAYTVAQEDVCLFNRRKQKFTRIYKKIRFNEDFNRLYLLHTNYFPIQSVMFERNLFEEMGGFRENVDCLEDWDLWVRYASVTDFLKVDKVTSAYKVILSFKRDLNLRKAYKTVNEYFSEYSYSWDLGTCQDELNSMIKSKFTSKFKRMLYRVGKKIIRN